MSGAGEQAFAEYLHAEDRRAELTVRATDVRSRTIRWAWRGRVPLGYLSVLVGLEGIGKSAFVAWMAAQATRGLLDGEHQGNPASVLVIAGEDGLSDVWRPRLEVADADLDRVHFLRFESLGDGWNVRDGAEDLREAIELTGARVVVFDALLDHFPPGKGAETVNSATFVRDALGPLRDLARDLHVAVVFSMHPPKGAKTEFRDMVQTSQAFTAIARTGLLVAWHPDDEARPEHDRRRVLLRGKGNIGRNPGGLAFRIEGADLEHGDGRTDSVPRVCEVDSCDVTLRDLAAGRGAADPDAAPVPKVEALADEMRTVLADGEWHRAADVLAGREYGKATVARAKSRVGVETEKRGFPAVAWWRIPSSQVDPVSLCGPRARSTSEGGTSGMDSPESPYEQAEGLRVSRDERAGPGVSPEGLRVQPPPPNARAGEARFVADLVTAFDATELTGGAA